MNQDEINNLQALLDAGTQGEWRITTRGVNLSFKEEDMDLIVNLRNSAPALLEAARENLKLREALEFYSHVSDYASPLTGGMGKLYFDCGSVAQKALGKEPV